MSAVPICNASVVMPRRSTFCFNLSSSRSEMTSNSSGGGDLAAVIMPANGNRQVFLPNTSGTDVVHAATLVGKVSSVSC